MHGVLFIDGQQPRVLCLYMQGRSYQRWCNTAPFLTSHIHMVPQHGAVIITPHTTAKEWLQVLPVEWGVQRRTEANVCVNKVENILRPPRPYSSQMRSFMCLPLRPLPEQRHHISLQRSAFWLCPVRPGDHACDGDRWQRGLTAGPPLFCNAGKRREVTLDAAVKEVLGRGLGGVRTIFCKGCVVSRLDDIPDA